MQKLLFLLGCSRQTKSQAISTPRFELSGNFRLAGLGLSRPIAARYLWDILFRLYLLKIGRPTPEHCRPTGGSRQNRWPTPGCTAAGVSGESQVAHAGRMRRKGISLNRFGGVGTPQGASRLPPGNWAVFALWRPGQKEVAAGTRVRWVLVLAARPNLPCRYVCR